MRKRRRISLILALCICIMTIASPIKICAAEFQPIPSVAAKAYTIVEADSGAVLYEKQCMNRIYPASTAKLMTALVAVERMSLSKKITVTKDAVDLVPVGAAKIGLKPGSKYTLNQLLHMLLISSAADAAEVIAVGVGGTQKNFAAMMNKKAKSLGMTKTSFDNPIGLDKGNKYNRTYTTAIDMSKLACHVMKVSAISNIVAKQKYSTTISKNKKKIHKNTNLFLTVPAYKSSAYTVIGTKTGFTNAAGACLIVTAVDHTGRKIICTYYGAKTHTQMYEEIRTLLDYTFSH